jgi:hypothetical protein
MVVGSVVEILFTLGNNYKKGAIIFPKSFKKILGYASLHISVHSHMRSHEAKFRPTHLELPSPEAR